MNLRELLNDAAAGLEEATIAAGPAGQATWSRGGTPFAVLHADGLAAEFKLDAAVAAAAVRTPDVTASPRGPGWVLFRQVDLDPHGADRALAWFASAYRRATSG